MTRVLFGVWAFSTTSMVDGAQRTYIILAEDNSAQRTTLWVPNNRGKTILCSNHRRHRVQTELNGQML